MPANTSIRPRICALAVIALIALPTFAAGSAQASTLRYFTGAASYIAGPGEVNRATVTLSYTPTSAGILWPTVNVTDVVPIALEGGICIHPGDNQLVATCGNKPFAGRRFTAAIDLGDGDDSVTVINRTGFRGGPIPLVYDGAGNDTVTTDASTVWSNGLGNDVFNGSPGPDLALPGSGSDTIRGWGGNDRINGGLGRDYLSGGAANDQIAGSVGNDRIYGGSGRDAMWGGPGSDRLYGGSDNDLLNGGSGFDRLFGGPGLDRINGRVANFVVG